MIKTMTTGEVREIATSLISSWDAEKNNISLSGKGLYNLIGLKKELTRLGTQMQETITTLALQNGGEEMENGAIKIPEENRAKVNEMLVKFSAEEIEVNYSPIILGENDSLPTGIMEAIFDFINLSE